MREIDNKRHQHEEYLLEKLQAPRSKTSCSVKTFRRAWKAA
jgi:hypothetical protein